MRLARAWRRFTCGPTRSAPARPRSWACHPRRLAPGCRWDFRWQLRDAGFHLDVKRPRRGHVRHRGVREQQCERTFHMCRVVRVRVVAPGTEVQLQIDSPSAGPVPAHVPARGLGVRRRGIGATSGIEAVHVWACPAAGGSPTFVGAATLGDARPDWRRSSDRGQPSPAFTSTSAAWRPAITSCGPSARPWRCRDSRSCRRYRLPSRRGPRPSRCRSSVVPRDAGEWHVRGSGLGPGARRAVGARHRSRARVGVSGRGWCTDVPGCGNARRRAA